MERIPACRSSMGGATGDGEGYCQRFRLLANDIALLGGSQCERGRRSSLCSWKRVAPCQHLRRVDSIMYGLIWHVGSCRLAPRRWRDPLRLDRFPATLCPGLRNHLRSRSGSVPDRPTPRSGARTPVSALKAAGVSERTGQYLEDLATGFRMDESRCSGSAAVQRRDHRLACLDPPDRTMETGVPDVFARSLGCLAGG